MELHKFNCPIALAMPLFSVSLAMSLVGLPLMVKAENSHELVEQLAPATLQTYKTASGDKLDRIIQKTMPDSPLKLELIRKAFIELNPQAFPGGHASRMLKGVELQIPNAPKLLTSHLAPISQKTVASEKTSGSRSADFEERRHWVRYP